MRIRYNHSRYDMPLKYGLKFIVYHSRRAKARRIMRALKRWAVYFFSYWLMALAIYTLVCMTTFCILISIHIYQTWNEALGEFASLLLGSVVLLLIKETYDKESSRHNALHQQKIASTNCQFELTDALRSLAQSAGLSTPGHSLLASLQDFNSEIEHLGNREPLIDQAHVQKMSFQIRRAIESLLDIASHVDFVDFNYSHAKERYRTTISEKLDSLEEKASLSKQEYRALASELLYYLAETRLPWHYEMDQKRNAEIRDYVETHGVKISS